MPVQQLVVNDEGAAAIEGEALTLIERIHVLEVVDQTSYDQATAFLLDDVKPFRKRWAEYWETVKRPLRDAMNAVQKKFRDGDDPLENAERMLKLEILRFDTEQERLRQELQRKAQEEADRAAEEERLRA